jgi:hypothetical protein
MRAAARSLTNPHPIPHFPLNATPLPGEAYDKVARMLGLELKPHGGAVLEALARRGDAARFPLPVPMRRHPNCDFSFAGLKTGVRLCIEKELPPPGAPGEGRGCACSTCQPPA